MSCTATAGAGAQTPTTTGAARASSGSSARKPNTFVIFCLRAPALMLDLVDSLKYVALDALQIWRRCRLRCCLQCPPPPLSQQRIGDRVVGVVLMRGTAWFVSVRSYIQADYYLLPAAEESAPLSWSRRQDAQRGAVMSPAQLQCIPSQLIRAVISVLHHITYVHVGTVTKTLSHRIIQRELPPRPAMARWICRVFLAPPCCLR